MEAIFIVKQVVFWVAFLQTFMRSWYARPLRSWVAQDETSWVCFIRYVRHLRA